MNTEVKHSYFTIEQRVPFKISTVLASSKKDVLLSIIAAILFTNLCATAIVCTLVTCLNACKSVLNNTFPILSLIFTPFKAATVFFSPELLIKLPTLPFTQFRRWPASFGQHTTRSSLQRQQVLYSYSRSLYFSPFQSRSCFY